MENVNNVLVSSDVDLFLGCNEPSRFGDIFKATLRFIALKHHQGNIETITPIKAGHANFNNSINTSSYIGYANDNNIELFILTANSSAHLPTIDENGWISLDTPPYPVALFLSKFSETRIYVNVELKKTIVFVRTATPKWVNFLCSSMFRVLPWYYEQQPDNEETAFFRAINKNDAETFNGIIDRTCEKYNFKELLLKKYLIGWCNGYREKRIVELKQRYESVQSDIQKYEHVLADYLNQLRNICYNINTIEAQEEDESDDTFYKFFLSHKQLEIYSIDKNASVGNIIKYCVTDTIEYFDKDEFIRVYNNRSSSIGTASEEVREILFNVFGTNRGAFRVEAIFKLVNLSSCEPVFGLRTGKYDNTHLAHPHLVYHACLGGNGSYIRQYMQSGDWDMAIEQTIAAVKNINFGDSVVIRKFVSDVQTALDLSRRCIIADNGKDMTPSEFLEYIRINNRNEDTKNG